MEKKLILWLFLFLSFSLYGTPYEKMKQSPFIQTNEDRNRLEAFSTLYAKALTTKVERNIPKIIHFIWLGSRELTGLQKKNIHAWVTLHPKWKVYFWSDKKRKGLPQKVLCRSIDGTKIYTNNFLEKETLLSYEILQKYGGVYIHPNLDCQKSLNVLLKKYSFFAQLMQPEERGTSSSIMMDHHLIGGEKQHPIFQKALNLVHERWNPVHKAFQFPGEQTAEYRLFYRSFLSLDDAILSQKTPNTVIFPVNDLYLSLQSNRFFKGPVQFQEKVHSYIKSFEKKNNKLNYIFIFNFILIVILFATVLFMRKKTKGIII